MALKNIGALWRKEMKNGTFLSGVIDAGVFGQFKIAVFQNKKGEGDANKPDARVCLFQDEPAPPPPPAKKRGK
jgi:hypothetical protein